MQKFRIKTKIKIIVLVFALIGLITIAGNFSLAVNKEAIDQGVRRYFADDVSVGHAYYIFPNIIILNNITIANNDQSIVFPKMTVRFMLWDLLFVEGLNITEVTLYPSTINYHVLARFVEDNFDQILEIIRSSPGNDLKVRVKPMLLDFDRLGQPDVITTELALNIENETIEIAGYARADQFRYDRDNGMILQRVAKGWPLWYKWQGHLKMDGLAIEHLILKSDNMYSKLWGDIRNGILQLNGFMFMDTTIQNSASAESSFAKYVKDLSVDHNMPNIDTYVLDIDALVHLTYPTFDIEKLNFTLNNVPVTLNGMLAFGDNPTLKAEMTLTHPELNKSDQIYFEKAIVHFQSVWRNKIFSTSGLADIHFFEHKDLSFSPKKGEIAFSDLKIKFNQARRAVFHLAAASISYWINTVEHRLVINDFKMITDTQQEGHKVVAFHAPFYSGILDGEMRMDTTQIPSRITSHIAMNNVPTDALEAFLVHFAKFNGRLSSTMVFKNYPRLDLSGELQIADGQLTNFQFFNWVADSFRLPTLKAIDFPMASAHFSINKNDFQLYDIRLRNQDVGLSGYYEIDHNNHVSSELTLALSKPILNDSSKFKPVMKIFEAEEGPLDFDFRLSGSLEAVNFQWVPSEVKSKIQSRIPDFIERQIERNIDVMMEAK